MKDTKRVWVKHHAADCTMLGSITQQGERSPLSTTLSELDSAIETLYAVFAAYQLSANFGDCSWLKEKHILAIRSKPLRTLDANDLSAYVNHVWMCGSVADFKYLLPRILEVFAAGGFIDKWDVLPEILFMDLNDELWSEVERSAVHAYLLALWKWFLDTFPCFLDPDEFLGYLVRYFNDLGLLLDIWDATNTLASLRQLALLATRAGYHPAWQQRRVQFEQVQIWLLRPFITERLENALTTYETEPFAEEFLDAIVLLQEWKNSFPEA